MRFSRTITLAATLLMLAAGASAQTSSEDFIRRYNNLQARVGPAGLGMETLIGQWEEALPEDPQMLLAKFWFNYTRCATTQVIQLSQDRYLGNEPILPFTDSLGVKRNFFEDTVYDDDLYREAESALDRLMGLYPLNLDYILLKADAMRLYEKGSPDMTREMLTSLIDRNYREHPAWVHSEIETVDNEVFEALIQQQCYNIFRLGTPSSAEAFKAISEKMLVYSKDNPVFMDNIGSYWLVSRKDTKKALKQYDMVLKKHPDDVTAIRNCILAARSAKDVKLEKKYLSMMARYGESETDRASAQARLDALSRK